jgi:peptidoglycan hydrolase-like protein with peptidoglycan-binding domain
MARFQPTAYGPGTEQAVRTFQSERGLGSTAGRAQAWPALVECRAVRSEGDAVRAAQVLLLEKFGYADIMVVDGLFGRGTEAVVKTFQSDHGLTPDGLVGASQTWPALISGQP